MIAQTYGNYSQLTIPVVVLICRLQVTYECTKTIHYSSSGPTIQFTDDFIPTIHISTIVYSQRPGRVPSHSALHDTNEGDGLAGQTTVQQSQLQTSQMDFTGRSTYVLYMTMPSTGKPA